VMVYGHANGQTEDDTIQAVQEYIAMGYKAVRAQCAIPGVVNAYGVGRGRLYYEPAQKGLPIESVWSTERYLDFVPPLFDRLRRDVGFDVHLLHDVHHRLTPIEAARLGKSLEPYRLFWLEDPVPAENQAAYRTIRQHTTTPIAVGEVFNTIYDCAQLIEEELIDYIRMTVVHSGGISHLRKIAALAELHHVRTGSHGATDLSPVAMAAALHFDLSVHNFGIQEYMRHTPETDAVFPHAYSFERGARHPGNAPGLGVDIDEVLAAHRNGALRAVFGCGTAAVITPVGELGWRGEKIVINGGVAGEVARKLYDAVTDIQYGRAPDTFGWMTKVA